MSRINGPVWLPAFQPRALDFARAVLAAAKVRASPLAAEPLRRASTDSADLTLGDSTAWAVAARAELSNVGTLLDSLRTGVDALRDSRSHADALARSQAALDEFTAGIARAATHGGAENPFGYRVENVNPGLHSLGLYSVDVRPGEVRDVILEVTLSAQNAALWLEFGGPQLDLGRGSSFVLEIAGVQGAQRFVFSSGITLNHVAAAFNSYGPSLGVVALASGSGVRLQSTAPGSSDFVSVRIIDDGGASFGGNGIYRMHSANANAVHWGSRRGFDSAEAQQGIKDRGQTLEARLDGRPVAAYGSRILGSASGFTANFGLSIGPAGPGELSAQTLGKALAFTIIGEGGDAAGRGGASLEAAAAVAPGQPFDARAVPRGRGPMAGAYGDAASVTEWLRAALLSAPHKAQPTHLAASVLPWLTPRTK